MLCLMIKISMKPKPEMMFGASAWRHIAGFKTRLKTLNDLLDEIDRPQSTGTETL